MTESPFYYSTSTGVAVPDASSESPVGEVVFTTDHIREERPLLLPDNLFSPSPKALEPVTMNLHLEIPISATCIAQHPTNYITYNKQIRELYHEALPTR